MDFETLISSNLTLYDSTLYGSTGCIQSLCGDYSRNGGKGLGSEFIMAKGCGIIELYTSDANTGALKLLSTTKIWSNIRNISNYRQQGSKRDHIVVGKK